MNRREFIVSAGTFGAFVATRLFGEARPAARPLNAVSYDAPKGEMCT